MKQWWAVVALMMFVLVVSACGSEEELELSDATVIGNVGGCQIENRNADIRVGVFGQKGDIDIVEIASIGIDPYDPSFQIKLEMEPPEDLQWVTEGDGVTQRTELLVLAYIDANEDGAYTEESEDMTVGSAEAAVYFFDQSYSPKNAVYGYNLLAAGGGGYTQDFAANLMYIAAGGCN